MTPMSRYIREYKWVNGSIAASIFWYVSLFPGRIGSDPVKAILLMRDGASTDWWTAQYFWVLKLTTLNGHQIWIASFVSIVVLYVSTCYFIFSLPEKNRTLQKTLFVISLSPLFGNFAVNINHDVFYTSGILLTVGFVFRKHYRKIKSVDKLVPFLAVIALTTTKSGFLIVAAFVLYFVCTKQIISKAFPIIALSAATFLISSVNNKKGN